MSETEHSPAESSVGALGTLAVVAGLAVQLLSPGDPTTDTAKQQQLAAERFAQIWGDCVDE